MTQKLSPSSAALLTIPPILWAGNAIVGQLVHEMVPPITLNFFRWVIASLILLPFGYAIFKPGSGLWLHRKRFAWLGLLGIGLYNALQYLALHSSSPMNVTLVASSMPVWMLLVGALFYGVSVTPRQVLGAVLSIAGVLLVLCRGDVGHLLALHLVAGDIFMIFAAIVWSFYSWLLIQPDSASKTQPNSKLNPQPIEPDFLRAHWATFLLAQVAFGVVWSGVFAAGEWAVTDAHIIWGWPLLAALLFVAFGPGVIAFRCWGVGVERAGPGVASFFSNLTPLFTALMSSAFLGELPHAYHIAAFALIVGGIVVSSWKLGQ